MHRVEKIRAYPPFCFQVCGEVPDITTAVLQRLSDRVPEALKLARLIGAAVFKGESGNSAGILLLFYKERTK